MSDQERSLGFYSDLATRHDSTLKQVVPVDNLLED